MTEATHQPESGGGHDHHDGPLNPETFTVDFSPVRAISIVLLLIGAIAFGVLGVINLGISGSGMQDFFTSYLVGVVFWASLPFGAIGMMSLAYLTTASWGVVLRRHFQAAQRTIPVLGLLCIPIVASVLISGNATQMDGNISPFWWADGSLNGPAAAINPDGGMKSFALVDGKEISVEGTAREGMRPEAIEEAHHKMHDYLNPVFFTIRIIGYLLLMGVFAWFYNAWGLKYEEIDEPAYWSKLRGLAGPGLLLWALTMTFFATDWVMSLEPTWASSMFPVVFGMNQFTTVFSVGVIVVYALTSGNPTITAIVKDKFRIDMGSLLFGFTMVWAYATFCQYMLVWAGNLPEEIAYYRKRGDHGWEYMAFFLMACHFLLPFIIFLFREVKTNRKVMQFLALWLLFVNASDVIWWIVPSNPRPDGGLTVLMSYAAILMVGGLWGLTYAWQLAKRPILPANSETQFLASWGHHH